MKKIQYWMLIMSSMFYILCSGEKSEGRKETDSDPSVNGYVPNEETAKKIAEALWLPVYGEKIYDEKPFVAKLINDTVWVVEGTLSKGLSGGTAYLEVNKRDCRVLKLTHFK